MIKQKVAVTKSGNYALWEKGGFSNGIGEVELICGKYAEKVKSIFVNNKKNPSEQCLIPVGKDSVIAKGFYNHQEKTFLLSLYKISQFIQKPNNEPEAVLEHVWTFDGVSWDTPSLKYVPNYRENLYEMVYTLIKKLITENCTQPMYYLNK